jgi:hypothetical protein
MESLQLDILRRIENEMYLHTVSFTATFSANGKK